MFTIITVSAVDGSIQKKIYNVDGGCQNSKTAVSIPEMRFFGLCAYNMEDISDEKQRLLNSSRE